MNTNSNKQTAVIAHFRSVGWTIRQSKIANLTFATKPNGANPDHIWVIAWEGSAIKPKWKQAFKSVASAESAIKELDERIFRSESKRAERKAKRATIKASDHWMVGDVAHTEWGSDQTNVEFFQVVGIKPKSVVVRQISVNSSDRGQPFGGKVAPRRFEFIGPEILCPVSEDGSFSAGPCWNADKPEYRHPCSKWDGAAVHTSSDR
jgi:hypothetical protein